MPNITQFLKMSYPSENDDPYFDEISSTFMQIDSNFFGVLASAGPIVGGGNYTFTQTSFGPNPPFQGNFTWTANFEVPIPGSNFYLEIPYGPDGMTRSITLNDGDRIIISVPISSGQTVTANLSKINGNLLTVPFQGLMTVGFYRSGVFYHNLPRHIP